MTLERKEPGPQRRIRPPTPSPLPLKSFLLLCLLAVSGALSAAPAKPNIVFILADDLGWHDVGYTNSTGFLETPNLDRLRKESLSFTNAYAGAANCAPSRACLLSGAWTPRHGVFAVESTSRGPKNLFRLEPVPNTQELKPSFVTLAEALKAQGYVTGHFGKWHLGEDKDGTGPRQQGFDVSDPSLIPPAGNEKPDDPKRTMSITKAACGFIETNRDKPFFAYIAHHAIHSALQARPETLKKFREKAKTTKADVKPIYAACTYDLDDSIGILLKKLADLGLDKNTLVIFTSDNGGTPQSPNEPLRGAKGAYYEAGIREPLLVRWPGVAPAGGECAVPVINQDFYPTFVRAAGGEPAPTLDGADLLPLLRGGKELSRQSIFWHFPGYLNDPVPRGRDKKFRTRPVSVIRKGDWKLFLYHEEWLLDGGREKLATNHAVELYNLRDDAGEHRDLANENTGKRNELLNELLAWIDKTHAPLPRPLEGAKEPEGGLQPASSPDPLPATDKAQPEPKPVPSAEDD